MARNTSFYYSFLVLPPDQRRAIIAVWDFCRAIDDSVDEIPMAAESQACAKVCGREAVRFWRSELSRCYDGASPETPVCQRLQPFVKALDLPRNAFEDVIDGVAMDLEVTRYATFADLCEYARRVASAVGFICIRVFGCRSERAREYALNLGLALQLTNILRDVADDLARDRVYLPLEDLEACGCTVDDLASGQLTSPVRRLIELECRRARDLYARAGDALPREERHRLIAAEIMRAVYFETLNRIELCGYDIFDSRIRVPRPRQAMIALRQWLSR
jgi:phytoene synthase